MKHARYGLLLFLATVFLADGAYAQGLLKDFPQGKWWTNKRIINQLNLSPDQQTKIESMWLQSRRPLIDQQAELQKRQLDLEELVNKETIDETAALEALDRVEKARASLEYSTLQMRIRIKNALSADQQQKLQTIAGMLRQQRARGEAGPIPKQAQPAIKK